MRYRDRTIKSIAQLLRALKAQSHPKRPIWFRGHGDKAWQLIPFLARNSDHLLAESAMIKRFMQNAAPLLAVQPREEWEWMFLMQHHRAGTRLLDWSENPLVALYFTVTDESCTRRDGAVWCLDPVALNAEAKLNYDFELEIPAFGLDRNLDSYLPSRVDESPASLFPAAIMGPRSTARMAAQLGTFTINHRLHTPIEKIGERKHVWKWIIPRNAKSSLKEELEQLSYRALAIFPDLDRVADLTKELLP